MSETNIVRYTRKRLPKGRSDWARVDALTDREVERAAAADPDARPTNARFWRDAKLVLPSPEGKEPVTLRLDRDVVRWFKARGQGYQTRMNAVLRVYMLAQKRPRGR